MTPTVEEIAKSTTSSNGDIDPAAHATLAAALLAVQTEVPAVEPDATNPHFQSKFVSLGNLISKVRPVLNRNGIVFAQFPSTGPEGQPTLTTILMHPDSGEREAFAAPLSPAKNDPQGQGSAITYMRRYALASALGVCDQVDDDGGRGSSRSSAKPAQLAPERVTALRDAMKAKGYGWDKVELMLGSAGANAPKARRKDSLLKALREMTPEQATALEGLIAADA